MGIIYASKDEGSSEKWEQGAVEHPGAIRKLAESKYGLKKGHKLTIHLLNKMHADAEKAGNLHRIRQINLAKTFVRQARRHKASASSEAVASVLSLAGIPHVAVGGGALDDYLAVTDRFQTGKPVTVKYVHNDTAAPKMGSRFGQDIEPSGFYFQEKYEKFNPPEGWSTGTEHIENPLVLDWGTSYSSADSWKRVLADAFGRTGPQLSATLIQQGYTHVITIQDGEPSEMVRLIAPALHKRSRPEL